MKHIAAGAFLLFTLVACSSSTPGTANGAGGASCGLSLTWSKSGAACDAWMAQHCCSQQQACAGDAACAAFVKCVNDCPIPRQDACTKACGTSVPTGVAAI